MTRVLTDMDTIWIRSGQSLPVPEAVQEAADAWPALVPEKYLRTELPPDACQALQRIVVPDARELDQVPGFTLDPTADTAAQRAPGLLVKYSGRALLMACQQCPMHCRYCFRRHRLEQPILSDASVLDTALELIESDTSASEIILSGGDPLMLPTDYLGELLQRCTRIAHVRRIRIHSRVPIARPDLLNGSFLELLTGIPRRLLMVVHACHPAELDSPAQDALLAISTRGVPTLSQSVLLRGVNDDPLVLARLFEALVDVGVIPYYLHQLDPVAGAAHFHVPPERGISIMRQLRASLPGYMVPRYVCEVPGCDHKVPLEAPQ
jgi:EF-P beta-lysylation protein EpmB